MVTATKTESITFTLSMADIDNLNQAGFADGYGIACDTVSGGYKCAPMGAGGSFVVASQSEAELGTENTKGMTALRTAQAILAQIPIVSNNNSYTPSWTASGTAPSLGNGSISGKYHRSGKWLACDIYMQIGSTTTKGSGEWYFSLPSGLTIDTSYMTTVVTGVTVLGNVNANRTGTSDQGGFIVYQDTGKVKLVNQGTTLAYWNTTVPVTWGTSDQLSLKFTVPITGWQ